MNEKEILDFKSSVCNLSLEELQEKKIEVDDSISKMILDSDLIVKAAILSALIDEKKEGKN